MTRRRWGTLIGVVSLVAAVAIGGCSGDSPDRDDASRSTPTSTAAPVPAANDWVARWRPVLLDEYAPAQQEFLGAIQGAKVAEVQQAAPLLAAASRALLQALRAAGPAPDAVRAAADRLETALAIEVALIDEVRRVCTGADDTCQPTVARYGDNNSQEIAPALVDLGALRE